MSSTHISTNKSTTKHADMNQPNQPTNNHEQPTGRTAGRRTAMNRSGIGLPQRLKNNEKEPQNVAKTMIKNNDV